MSALSAHRNSVLTYNRNMAQLPRRKSSSAVPPIIAASSVLAGVGLVLAWTAYSRTRIEHNLPLTAALDADLRVFESPSAGTLGYYAGGTAQRGTHPLLLIHGINSAASSFQMRPLFDRFARSRRVYALDLPGFGFSSRGDRPYSAALMRDAICEFVRGTFKKESVDAVAFALSSEFLAQAAQLQPASFRTLTFLTPTGFGERPPRARPALTRLLRAPFWRRPIFDLLTSRPFLRHFAQQRARRALPRAFSDYAYASSHQIGAEFAPIAYLSAQLHAPGIRETYLSLKQPCLVVRGRDTFASYERLDEIFERPNWRDSAFDRAGSLVHWDFPETVSQLIESHIK